jgi:hypothetical protein
MLELHGVRIPTGPRFSPVILEAIQAGKYERQEHALLAALLRDDDRVLELGTGAGFLATYCAQRLGSSQVTTVEADPEMAPVIEATLAENLVSPKVIYAAVTALGLSRRLPWWTALRSEISSATTPRPCSWWTSRAARASSDPPCSPGYGP